MLTSPKTSRIARKLVWLNNEGQEGFLHRDLLIDNVSHVVVFLAVSRRLLALKKKTKLS